MDNLMAGMTRVVPAVVSALLLGMGAALAEEPASPYIQIGAGANFLESTEFTLPSGQNTQSNLNFDTGPVVTGSVGYAFGNGLRAEFELGYRSSSASNITLPNGNTTSGNFLQNSNFDVYTYIANVVYDFDLGRYFGPRWAAWSPHIGGGIGAAVVNTTHAPSETVFAGQAIGGVEYRYRPNLRFGLDYRYVGTESVNLNFTQVGIATGRNVSASYHDHAVLLTLRWDFR